MSFQISGIPQLVTTLDRIQAATVQQAESALFRRAEAVMAQSKEAYVPVDEAVLKASGYVALPLTEGDTIRCELGFGGAAADYAVVQHENLEFRHTVGGPKYLERPLLDAAATLERDLAALISVERAAR